MKRKVAAGSASLLGSGRRCKPSDGVRGGNPGAKHIQPKRAVMRGEKGRKAHNS